MTDQSKKTKMSNEQFNQWCDRFEKENGFRKVVPPKDAGAVVMFPDADNKVDMIDAVERLYGIKHDKGDRVIKIRGGKVVSDEVVEYANRSHSWWDDISLIGISIRTNRGSFLNT